MDIFERVLFNANSAIYQLQQTTCQSADDEVDFTRLGRMLIVLAHWNNNPPIDMLLHSDALSWFGANQHLHILLNAACKYQLFSLWFDPTEARTINLPNLRLIRQPIHHRCGWIMKNVWMVKNNWNSTNIWNTLTITCFCLVKCWTCTSVVQRFGYNGSISSGDPLEI